MNKSTSIRTSLEKILKAILVKIESGDELSVSEELIWFDNLIDRFFLIHKSNPNLFYEIFDPKNYYRIKDNLDPKNLYLREGNITAKKAYLISSLDAEYGLLDTLYSFSKKIWDLAIKLDRNEVSIRARKSYGKFYYLISTLSDTKFKYTEFYKFFFDKLFLRLIFLLSKDTKLISDASFSNYLLIKSPLESFSDENFPKENVEFIQRVLFIGLKVGVDYDQDIFIKDYIRLATNLFFLPSWSSRLDDIESLVYSKLGSDNALSKPINQLVYRRSTSVFTQKDFQETVDSLIDIKAKVEESIENLSPKDILIIDNCVDAITVYSFQFYKYRQIQKALNQILIYSIFRKKYDLIEFAFEFHSPLDNTASWSNNDIVFNDLFDILRYLSFRFEIENELMFYWPDHHGVSKYIDIYVIALITRWVKNRTDLVYSSRVEVERVKELEEIKGEFNLKQWDAEITELENISKQLAKEKHWPFNNQINYELSNLVLDCLRIIKDQFTRNDKN